MRGRTLFLAALGVVIGSAYPAAAQPHGGTGPGDSHERREPERRHDDGPRQEDRGGHDDAPHKGDGHDRDRCRSDDHHEVWFRANRHSWKLHGVFHHSKEATRAVRQLERDHLEARIVSTDRRHHATACRTCRADRHADERH